MQKKEAKLPFYLLFQRSGRDSNPRAVARKLISSQPRYDHFDTAACVPHLAVCTLYKKGPVLSTGTLLRKRTAFAVLFSQSVGESNPCFRRERAAS